MTHPIPTPTHAVSSENPNQTGHAAIAAFAVSNTNPIPLPRNYCPNQQHPNQRHPNQQHPNHPYRAATVKERCSNPRMRTIVVPTLILASLALAATTQAQIPTANFPLSTAVTPDNKYLIVLTTQQPTLSVIDLSTSKELSRTPIPDAFLGLTLNRTGNKIYVGGGTKAAVFEFNFAQGAITPGRTFPISAGKDRNPQDYAGDVRLDPEGHLLYVTNLFRDTVVVMNPQSGLILSRFKTGRRPYRILFHPSGKTVYVSSWADGTIGQYDINSGERLSNFRVAPHPIDMLWLEGGLPEGATAPAEGPAIKARMFVPGANTNGLFVFGASESGDLTKLESVNLALTQRQPLGMTPSALGISADKKQVYVVCSGINAIAVVDITGERNRVAGFIPTGEYPTAVTALPDGRIVVSNGHGNSVQLIDAPDEAKLGPLTDQVMATSRFKDDMLDPPTPPVGNPVHADGPIKHVIYVVTGNDPEPAIAAMETDYAARIHNAPDAGGAPDPASLPPTGYIWNATSQAGLKIRNYGFLVHNRDKATEDGEQVDRAYDPILAASTDMEYRGPDPAYPDTERAKEFANEMKEFEEAGEMPQLLLVRIGPDEKAIAIVEEALSKSKFRAETAMFVTGAVPRVVYSGTRRDLTTASPFSALRTIEIILGLRPITIFDASAAPLFAAFSSTPTGAQ